MDNSAQLSGSDQVDNFVIGVATRASTEGEVPFATFEVDDCTLGALMLRDGQTFDDVAVAGLYRGIQNMETKVAPGSIDGLNLGGATCAQIVLGTILPTLIGLAKIYLERNGYTIDTDPRSLSPGVYLAQDRPTV